MNCKQILIIALGTNINQKSNMHHAMKLLHSVWHDMQFTRIVWTHPIGMATEQFYNCIAYTWANNNIDTIIQTLKNIETKCGNTLQERALQRIQMDIDVLQYGNKKMHECDWKRDYIQQLLQDVNIKIEQI